MYNEHAWKKMLVRKKLKYVCIWPLSLFNPINWRIHFIRLSTTWTHVLRMLSRSGVKLITFLLQGRTLPMAKLIVEFQVWEYKIQLNFSKDSLICTPWLEYFAKQKLKITFPKFWYPSIIPFKKGLKFPSTIHSYVNMSH